MMSTKRMIMLLSDLICGLAFINDPYSFHSHFLVSMVSHSHSITEIRFLETCQIDLMCFRGMAAEFKVIYMLNACYMEAWHWLQPHICQPFACDRICHVPLATLCPTLCGCMTEAYISRWCLKSSLLQFLTVSFLLLYLY